MPTQVYPSQVNEAQDVDEPEDLATEDAYGTFDIEEPVSADAYGMFDFEEVESAKGSQSIGESSPVREGQPVKDSDPVKDSMDAAQAAVIMMKAMAQEVSDANAKKRLSRMMKPRVDGSYLVPKEIVDLYNDLAKRVEVEAEFIRCGLDKDSHAWG